MRILHVVPYYPPERIGGVGEVVAHLHRGLLQAGHDSEVLTTGFGRRDPRVHQVGRSPTWFAASSIRHARELGRYDVIHFHHGEALGLIVVAALRRNRPRLLLTMHVSNWRIRDSLKPYSVGETSFGTRDWRNLAHRWIKAPAKAFFDRLARALVDDTNFISRAGAREVLGWIAGDAARVIHNGLPELPQRRVESTDGAELIYVGRPGVGKRVDLLPIILMGVRQKIPAARLKIVGFDRGSVPDLARTFTELGLDSAVSFAGAVSSHELRSHYESAGVLVVPSAYEGLPMVILEALQCGLPCIATRVGGNSEVIENGVNGFLVGEDDPRAMAKRCAQILADRGQAESMGRAAERTVRERFALDQQVTAYQALYASMGTS